VEIANPGERLAAFFVDIAFWALATVALILAFFALIAQKAPADVVATAFLFAGFLMRNLYFIHFEIAMRGATPGKRLLKLRVIDRNGGGLTRGAVVARNLTREVEIFLPLGLALTLPANAGDWSAPLYLLWMASLSAFPFFNRDRLRAGDVIAGTMVIALPRRTLLAELAQAPAAADFVFTAQQLGAYGAFELQVLEEILRRPPSSQTMALQRDVRRRICAKIGWSEKIDDADALEFLRAFYSAERAYLEREQLFGKYHEDKESAAGRRSPP
jgi:uncharacterized RDD family membrane protein YckC